MTTPKITFEQARRGGVVGMVPHDPPLRTSDTPLTDARVRRVRIENEDSCCAIYVKVDGVPYEGDLVDADYARSLERELAAAREDSARYAYLKAHWDDFTGRTWGDPAKSLDAAIDAARKENNPVRHEGAKPRSCL